MSFDPITLAMAKPKTIDLDKYGIGQSILGLFAQGGGTHSVENLEQFWIDTTTDKELRLEMNYSSYRFVIDQCVRLYDFIEDMTGMLSFSFLVFDETSLDYHNVSVCINRGYNYKAVIGVEVS